MKVVITKEKRAVLRDVSGIPQIHGFMQTHAVKIYTVNQVWNARNRSQTQMS
jgi:hypothetical protein